MEKFFPRVFYRLKFEVILPIDNLEYYQGVYWSAMLRHWCRPYFNAPLSELGLCPVPVHNGMREYMPGEQLALDLSLPQEHQKELLELFNDELQGFPRAAIPPGKLHFYPSRSMRLLAYELLCLTEGKSFLDIESIMLEASYLQDKNSSLNIVFHTPLRLKPTADTKHGYSFLDPLGFDSGSFFSALCREFSITSDDFPSLENKGLIWLDVPYEKTLGGLIGGIRIDMPKDRNVLLALVAGQYCGIGKNRSFGFGFYYLEESPGFRSEPPEACYTSFLQRCSAMDNLRTALENMKSGSPGPDNLAREDLLDCGSTYLNNASKVLRSGSLDPGDTLNFKKRSPNGNYRLITIQNIHERHLLIAILQQINGCMDSLLSPGCYSYRSGRDYHQAAKRVYATFRKGFSKGIKADIRAFFDSIDRTGLRLLLKGLFNTDPLADFIAGYMLSPGLGIAQGNPLSPLLSNLWLIAFDHEIKNRGWFMVRYADDFCVFCDEHNKNSLSMESLNSILAGIKLSLAEDKSHPFTTEEGVTFVGYAIDKSRCEKMKAIKVEDYSLNGIPAFQDDYRKGKPLYLTFKDSYVRFDNGSMVIQKEGENRTIGMKEISRIIVIGKPRISAGAIQQALLLHKPVVFMGINGHILGGFAQNQKLFSPAFIYNPLVRNWDDFSLQFIRALVAAKLHNQRLVLKQSKIEEPKLKELELSLGSCVDSDSLRGKEGAGSAVYWSHFRELVKPLDFPRRSYHPPEGPVNALLSIGYSNLYFRVAECLQAAQLNPYEGIFHAPRGLHYALASDMIEPYRFLVDRMVLSLIHNNQIGKDDFINTSYGAYSRLAPQAMKSYIHKYEQTMRTEVKLGEDTFTWATLIDRSAAQLMRCLRLGIDFRPFRIK